MQAHPMEEGKLSFLKSVIPSSRNQSEVIST